MIIPYATDAPIYHWPRATIAMIVANVAVYAAWWAVPPEAIEPYALLTGSGLRPVQWLTHNFLHADILHITFNMIFLWSYGIIVEGKVGWLWFTAIYLGIGTLHGAALQAAYLGAAHPTHVLGASSIIFGLMAICMIWAPVNELSCLLLLFAGFRIITRVFEMPIYGLVILQLALEAGGMALQYAARGDPLSSELLHLSGALWGLAVGLILLKTGLVDCEGYDAFSMVAKRRALRQAWKAREARLDRSAVNERLPRLTRPIEDRPGLAPEERSAKVLAKLMGLIEMGDTLAASAAFDSWMVVTGKTPPRAELLGVIKALNARQAWAESLPPMRAFCRLYPEASARVRLRLAGLLIRNFDRPTEALRHLGAVPDDALDANLRVHRRALVAEAEAMVEDGVLELEEEA